MGTEAAPAADAAGGGGGGVAVASTPPMEVAVAVHGPGTLVGEVSPGSAAGKEKPRQPPYGPRGKGGGAAAASPGGAPTCRPCGAA